ncbi:hypothetical protein [Streptomyces sp. NPDC096132]|uniref:hypothetical protein n=1 Tax=Streptomyces sp. NPDC096132 TaxID=3366075 RepID=UPI00382BE389
MSTSSTSPPVVLPHPGMEFDPVTMVGGQLEQVRRLAESEGRDPADIGAALRVNPVAESSVDAVVEVILRTRDAIDVDDVFVDFTYMVDNGGVDQAMELLQQTLDLTR